MVLDNLLAQYTDSLADITEAGEADGIAVGHAAALAMFAKRMDDGRFGPFRFPAEAPYDAGEWRPDLPANVNDPNGWVARVKPFTLENTFQFRTAGPFALTSPEYAAEFNEVKALGAASGSTRTPEQTTLARFFAANPLPMMNGGFREIATGQGLSLAENARLFAMSSMSSADALINCWDDKAFHNFWRPITAIREAANDGNPATEPVPVTDPPTPWMPFIGTFVAAGTPPYPDHPSGYNCFTGAMMNTAAMYFRTEHITLNLTSPITATTITYKRFTAVLKDTIDARIYQGLHFRNPDVQGAWLGKKVAKWVDKNFFQPVN